MKTSIKLEIKKAVSNKYFAAAFLISLIIAIAGAFISSRATLSTWERCVEWFTDSQGNWNKNPNIASTTLFNTWIGGEYQTWASNIFYFLLPLLCTIPYGWSILSDKKTGYIRNQVVLLGRKKYFIAKYTASFFTGFLVIVVPLIINYIIVACLVPARLPDVIYDIYYAVPPDALWSVLFYNHPILFDILYIFMAALFAGLWACVPLALGMVLKSKLAALILPYIALVGYQNVADTLFQYRIYLEVSPFRFLRACETRNAANGYVLLFIFLIVFLIPFLFIYRKGVRDEIF